jgi:hypothetical protein
MILRVASRICILHMDSKLNNPNSQSRRPRRTSDKYAICSAAVIYTNKRLVGQEFHQKLTIHRAACWSMFFIYYLAVRVGRIYAAEFLGFNLRPPGAYIDS